MIAVLVAGGAALGVLVWVLAKIGQALIKVAEALTAAAVVVFAVWLVVKAVVWAIRQAVIHWRTSLTVLAVAAWSRWWGWPSLALAVGVVAVVLIGWRLIDLVCSTPGRVGICVHGGCAGRFTRRSCPTGCGRVVWVSSATRRPWWSR